MQSIYDLVSYGIDAIAFVLNFPFWLVETFAGLSEPIVDVVHHCPAFLQPLLILGFSVVVLFAVIRVFF